MKLIKSGFVVITNTICSGPTITCRINDPVFKKSIPVFYENELQAWKTVAEDLIEELQQFINDERNFEETGFSTEEYVVFAELYENETIKIYDVADSVKTFSHEITIDKLNS